MMVWLRESDASMPAIGLDDELIPARSHARLMALDEVCQALREHCDVQLAQAERQAQQLLAQAREEAKELLARARVEFDRAAERGAEEGRTQALAQWWEEASAALTLRHAASGAMREQIASLVVEAVSRIVRASAPAELFVRAAQTVERILGETGSVTVRVRADEEPIARTAFEEVARHWQALGRVVSVRLVPSLELPPGSCICHSEVGTIDASLDVQLRALAQVVQRSVEQQA